MAGRRNTNTHAHDEFAVAMSVTRFWDLVDRRTSGGCWEWLGDVDRNGYGIFYWRGRRVGAHELALSFATGEKRGGNLDTCHSCDRPSCVNPKHLRFDTRSANVADMINRGRRARTGRLSDSDVLLIRQRRAAGARQKDLAEQFGVSDGQISMIVRGIRWPEVGGPIETKRNQYNRKAS